MRRADLAPPPDLAAAAAEATRADREADRERVDPARAERLADQLDRGDERVPGVVRSVAADLESLARTSADPAAVERLFAAAGKWGPDEREAARRHMHRQLAKPRASAAPAVARRAIPDLDVDDLLGGVPIARAQVEAIARRALSCEDLPALAFLAAASSALAAKVRGVTTNNDGSAWRIWPHLFIGAEVPSGASKSLTADAVLRDFLAGPGGTWTKFKREAEPDAAADEAERAAARARKSALERRADPDEAELAALVERLRRPRVREPVVPELGASSCEHFVRVCHWTGFRAVVPDEAADFLQRFLGNRESGERVGPLIAGFDGGEFAYSSIEGEKRDDHLARFPRLHLSILLLLQEGVLSPRVQEEASRLQAVADRGFFPRCLIARPRALLRAERHALEAEAARLAGEGAEVGAAYGRVLRSIADARVGEHPLCPSQPVLVPFTAEATAARRAYQVRCGDDVAADGPDAGKPGARSIARLHDHAARIAICLACWRCAEEADAAGRELDLAAAVVELDDVERAIRACEQYFRPHALAVAGRAILDPVGADAEHVLQALGRCPELAGGAAMSKREISRKHFRQGWGRLPGGRHRLNDALEELERRGDVELDQQAKNVTLVRLAVR